MGACCAADETNTVQQMGEVMKDLPAPTPSGDCYQQFECTLPFNRISITDFEAKVMEARPDKKVDEGADPEKEEFVTFESLRQTLTTNAWKDLTVGDSKLHKLLSSDAFAMKADNGAFTAGQISVQSLMVMGLLHCQGKAEQKAKVLYCVLQDGGPEDHAQISASDKDLVPVF